MLTSSLQGFLAVPQADLAHGDPRTFALDVAFGVAAVDTGVFISAAVVLFALLGVFTGSSLILILGRLKAGLAEL